MFSKINFIPKLWYKNSLFSTSFCNFILLAESHFIEAMKLLFWSWWCKFRGKEANYPSLFKYLRLLSLDLLLILNTKENPCLCYFRKFSREQNVVNIFPPLRTWLRKWTSSWNMGLSCSLILKWLFRNILYLLLNSCWKCRRQKKR